MKMKNILLGIVCIIALTGFDWPWSLEGKIEGKWQMEKGYVFVFKGGTMSVAGSSRVFATYKILDKNSILYTRKTDDSTSESIVIVTFPSSQTMVWSVESFGKTNTWWTFERIKD